MTHSILEQIGIIAIAASILLSIVGAVWRMIIIIDHEDSIKSLNKEITTIHVRLNNMEDKLKK
jgi:hypothetical protein